jgi:hypothetical protein
MSPLPVRIAFAVGAWAFVAAIVLQVFFAGIGVFTTGSDRFSLHVGFGWLLPLVPLVVLLLAAVAGAGRTTGLSALLLLLVVIQMALPAMRGDLPLVAALHPVNALVIFAVALVVARRATALARQPSASATQEADLAPTHP